MAEDFSGQPQQQHQLAVGGRAVLSRIAENIYWIGRYMERADDTSRLLSTHLYGLLQAGSPNDRLLPEEVLAILGRDQSALSSAPMNLQTVAWHYIADPDTDSSVLNCLHLARENARRSQQQLAVEAWESLNTSATTLEPLIDQAASIGELLRVVPQLTQSFFGVVHTALQRDETWTFLQLGMLLERADMTLRILLLGAKAVADRDAQRPAGGAHAGDLDARLRRAGRPALVGHRRADRPRRCVTCCCASRPARGRCGSASTASRS